jgi:competence protein ComEC
VATLATAPLVFLNFQQIPVLSMVANVLAMPVVAFIIMPGTFFSYLLTPFPVIGDWVIKYMGFGVTLLLKISQFTTSLPLAVWRMPAVPVLPVLLMMIGLFLPVVLVRRWRLIGIAPIVFGLILLSFHDRVDLYLTGNRLVVMPGPAGLYIDGRVDGFSRNLFLQFNGQTKLANFPCDTDICTITQKGKTIRILRTIESLDQACAEKADLILTRYYLDEHCADTMTIDRHVTDRHGGVAITLDPLHYTPVYKTFVRRPWQKSLNQGWSSQNSGVKVKPDDDQTTP